MAYTKRKPLSSEEKTDLIKKYKEEVDEYTLNVASKVMDIITTDEKYNELPAWEHPVFNKFYMNPESGTRFNMENSILLYLTMKECGYKHSLFLTAKQGFDNGMSMEKGTKGHYIVQRFGLKMHPLAEIDENGKPKKDTQGKTIYKRNEEGEIQYLFKRCEKLVKVFNIEQFTGEIPAKWLKYMTGNEEKLSNENELQSLKNVVFKSIEPEVIRHLSKDNFYMPLADVIYLSEPQMFKNTLQELSTTFHEWSHSTGHKERLNRESLYRYSEDKSIRGYEELVANFAARRLCNFYNMESSELIESFNSNHDKYDSGWASHAFKSGPEQIFKAAVDADRAFNRIRMAIEPNLKLDASLKGFLTKKIESEETENQENEEKSTKKFNQKRSI